MELLPNPMPGWVVTKLSSKKDENKTPANWLVIRCPLARPSKSMTVAWAGVVFAAPTIA
jgi:hypothetical protein